jgi:hypothetical protein
VVAEGVNAIVRALRGFRARQGAVSIQCECVAFTKARLHGMLGTHFPLSPLIESPDYRTRISFPDTTGFLLPPSWTRPRIA